MTAEEPVGRREDDASLPILAHRLTALEKRVDSGFRHLDERLDSLGFVRADVYAANQIALEQQLKTMRDDIDDAAKPGRWALGVIGSTFLIVLIGIIVQVALQLVENGS